jgi:hypothetical protein
MKAILVIFAVVCGIQLIASQEVRECIDNVVIELEIENAGDWIADLNDTVTRLQDNRRRCDEILNDRMREACITAWQVTVAAELARLGSDLRTIAGDEKSAEFIRLASDCFGVPQPEEPAFEKPE